MRITYHSFHRFREKKDSPAVVALIMFFTRAIAHSFLRGHSPDLFSLAVCLPERVKTEVPVASISP